MLHKNKVKLSHLSFTNSENMIFISSLKKLVDRKNAKVKFDYSPKTNDDSMSVTYGCIIFTDSYRFLSSRWDSLVKTLVNIDFEFSKKGVPGKWEHPNKQLAYPFDHFNSFDDYKKPVDNLRKGDFFSKLKKVIQMIIK